MADDRFLLGTNGQELQQADINMIAMIASAAEDHVFAEVLRPQFYVSSVAKAILPYGVFNGAAANSTTVSVGGNLGAVLINPFRAVLGSRAAIGAAAPPPATSGTYSARDNWRDIRTATFPALITPLAGQVQTLNSNSSGSPRWDLIYAVFTVDANTTGVSRYVKNTTTKVVAAATVVTTTTQAITIGVVQGTPNASPVFPALPADAAPTYYIPLAYVRVINGFTIGVTPLNNMDIVDCAPVAHISRTLGGAASCHPANQSTCLTGSVTATNFPWTGVSNSRPAPHIPPSMVGMESMFVAVDLLTSGAYSHPNGSVVDASRDWRNRIFLTQAYVSSNSSTAESFPWIGGATTMNGRVPSAVGTNSALLTQYGQSFYSDSGQTGFPSGTSAVFFASHTQMAPVVAGGLFGLYVDPAFGSLFMYVGTNPAVRGFLWIFATAPYPNA